MNFDASTISKTKTLERQKHGIVWFMMLK